MRVFYGLAILIAAIYVFSSGPIAIAAPVYDVSWPQCDLSKPTNARNGIVGVTGGLSLHSNPCLAKQAGWFSREGAYINTGYPGPAKALKFKNWPKSCAKTDERCLAYNYGFNAARYGTNYAMNSGVIAKNWWLDVETENSWSDSTAVNRQALLGGYDALSDFGGSANVGYYSYPDQWNIITGGWLNGSAIWVATGSINKASAAIACQGPSFTGGRIVLAQYTNGLDQNIACSNPKISNFYQSQNLKGNRY